MGFKSPEYRLPLTLLGVVAGSLFFSGCGDGNLESEHEQGETVLYSQTHRIRGLDPATAGEVSSSLAIARIYEGLLQYDYLMRPYKVVPLLAESMPAISDDGLTYTFKIRQGIHFQDDPCFPGGKGRELVAEDFVYSFKRVADVKNISSGFWAFDRILGIDGFLEASKSRDATHYDLAVEGLKALDRYTFQIRLSKPYPQFLYVLAMHYACAVPREAVEMYGRNFSNHPVGTGPYRLVSWRRSSRIEFERNPKWAETGRVDPYPSEAPPEMEARGLLADAGKPLPFIDRVIQFVVEDETTAWMMFLSDEPSSSAISRDNWNAVMTVDKGISDSLQKRGISLITAPTMELFYLGFNYEDPVLGYSDDPAENLKHRKLRQALSCAYSFDRMNQFLNNRYYPISGPIPEPLPGCRTEPSPYGYNLEKAKRLLAEAGYPEGQDSKTGRRLELTLEIGSGDSTARQSVELLADMFGQIGVVLKPSVNTWPAFIEKMNRRQSQMFELGWTGDYPDAENFLQLFYSKNESPGPNHCNYRNAEFDKLYEEIRVMQDCPERTARYVRMSDMVVEDCPWIFMYQPMSFVLGHGWIGNYEPHAFPYGMGKYLRLDQKVQDQWRESFKDRKMSISGQE